MDPKEFERLFGAPSSTADDSGTPDAPSQQPQDAPQDTPQPYLRNAEELIASMGEAAPQLDPQQLSNLLGAMQSGADAAGQQPPQSLPDVVAASLGAPGVPQDGRPMTPEEKAGAAVMAGIPVATGAMKSVFETKDFLFGDTPRDRQSAFRQSIEDLDAQLKDAHPVIAGLSSGIGQFATAMIGLGKLGYVAKALPYAGEALAAGETALKGLKYGKVALESGKAALAGSIAFDPHEQRLSNMIQDTPLANPFNAWLAAKPEDSAALGRIKNAMESLGMDAAIIGTFTGALKVMKYLKAGKVPEARRVITQMEADRVAHVEQSQATGVTVAPAETAPSLTPEAPAPGAAPKRDFLDVTTPESPKAPAIKSDITVTPAQASSIVDDMNATLENAQKDWETMSQYGQWSSALDSGKSLSPDMGTFYDRFKTDNELTQFVDLAVQHKADELETAGFRGRLSDSKLTQQVYAYASMLGEDPSQLMANLRQAGEASRSMTAQMLVSGSLTAKAFQDASLMAMRMKMGDYAQFGSRAAMEAEISKRFSIATTLLSYTDQMRAQAGRSLRALRGRPFDPSLFEGVAKDRFYDLLAQAEGNPKKLKVIADPSLYRKILDTVNYMRVSSLVSGPKTQLINLISNGYMTGIRPMERILGSIPGAVSGNDASKALIKENLRQYLYMGSALQDSFSQAVKAFTRNDGLLKPHSSEMYGEIAGGGTRWQVPGTQAIGKGYFKTWDSLPNVIHNALSVPLTVAGVPTRALGGMDELVKQIVYRSKLTARAYTEGTEKALEAGLDGKAAKAFIKSYMEDRLDNAFDAAGRGLDHDALHEANIATFQQDLLPGTYGKLAQNAIAGDKTQALRLILPFIKTPTNVIRYGWKMTPGLNLLQEEYRQMFSGAMGAEAKAQAIGQITMGSLFMGTAAFIGSQGMLTGGGPSDHYLKSQLLATGYQPYSIVFENEDGTKTYLPFNRYDPVALPFGIIADIQDALHIVRESGQDPDQHHEIQAAIGALTVGLAKQFTSRTYMLSLNQALEALQEPDGQRATYFVGGIAQSFIPFSAASRQLSTDPYLRDARTVADRMLQVIPGFSKDLPPRYDWLGQPILNRQGLWSSDNGSLVDRETQRLALEAGTLMGPPSPSWNKVDLREITTAKGENAYDLYQRLSGKPGPNVKPLRDAVADVMKSKAYERAPDGDIGTRGTKMWLIATRVSKYREIAARRLKADPNVREALLKAQRRVVDHYQHLKVEPTPQQKDGLDAILKGYGQ
jgi:hypothetical protein